MPPHCAIRSAPLGVLLTLMACSSGDSTPGYPSAGSPPARLDRSGSRLEVRGYEVDGIFVLDGLYDTKLGLMCVPAIASDGVERCVPRDVRPLGPYADGMDSGPDYAEVACSTPLITIPKGTCADPTRILVRSSGSPGGRDGVSYWRIGAPKQPAKIYPATFGTCIESAPDPAHDYYERGVPLEPAELVAFVRRDAAVSPALRAVVLEGEDGSRLQAARDFIDIARSEPCEIALAEDGVTRCTPLSANLYNARTYADASCSKRAAFNSASCLGGLGKCDDSTVTEQFVGDTSDACATSRRRFFAAGPPVATNEVHFGSGPAECGAPVKQGSSIIEVGAPIEPTTFPPVLPDSVMRRARLVERTLLVGGAPVKQSAVFDPQIDDECSFEKAADGKVRCLPAHTASATPGFADAACTTPLFSPRDACQPTPQYARVVEGSACDPVVRIRAVTPATRAFERRDGACVEARLYPGTFVAGDELAATSFVEATPSTR